MDEGLLASDWMLTRRRTCSTPWPPPRWSKRRLSIVAGRQAPWPMVSREASDRRFDRVRSKQSLL